MSRYARISWEDVPRGNQSHRRNRRDERAPIGTEVRQLLTELGYPIKFVGGDGFLSTCPICKAPGDTLRCRFYDGPTLTPVLRCRQCRASPSDLLQELRVAGVVARAQTRLASHPARQPLPKTQDLN